MANGKSLASHSIGQSEKVLLSDESGGAALLNKKQFPSVSGWIGDTRNTRTTCEGSRALTGMRPNSAVWTLCICPKCWKLYGKNRRGGSQTPEDVR